MFNKDRKRHIFLSLIIAFLCLSAVIGSVADSDNYALDNDEKITSIESFVTKKMKDGNIPGMTVVIVKGGEIAYMNHWGYADVQNKIPVTSETSFEIASCSKAFTGLAALKLEKDGLLSLDDPVSKFFPWFEARYKETHAEITLRQLLHHTSGIPWFSITEIPISKEPDALEAVVRNVSGVELHNLPGKQFEYATINYAIVGAVIQEVTGELYENYMKKNIFGVLELENTTLYPEEAKDTLAMGYKNGFFRAREFQSPVFRGNRPAGYVIMDGKDLGKWLMYNLGSLETDLESLIMATHYPDRTVPPSRFDLSSYAMGWADYQLGNGEVSKSGLNPNFSAYMVLRPEDDMAVGVMANSATTYTFITGHGILDILKDKKPTSPYEEDRKMDNTFSTISIMTLVYILLTLVYISTVLIDIFNKNRKWEALSMKKSINSIIGLICCIPFFYALYLIPMAFQGVSWITAIVWSPYSFEFAVRALSVAALLSFICIGMNMVFPKKETKIERIPSLVIISLLSGGANAAVIFIVTLSIGSDIPLKYLLLYYSLALILYIFGRKLIESQLVRIAYNIINQKRLELIDSIMKCSYSCIENIESGRIFATLNNDTELVGLSANIVVGFTTSLLTIICCFIYLATISFWGTLISLVVIGIFAFFYNQVNASASRYWERARDTQNVYMGFIDQMLKGIKELSMHRQKKIEFIRDVEDSCEQYRISRSKSRIKFTNAIVLGESLLILILGAVAFVFPEIFPDIKDITLIKFIFVLLYLIGPINGLLQTVPDMMQIQNSWKRIQEFAKDIPSQEAESEFDLTVNHRGNKIERIKFNDLFYQYSSSDREKSFGVGPITIEASRGEIVFIIGGNGSGKTTLAKLMVGLYPPEMGYVTVNGKKVDSYNLGEHFSVVFSDFHLFKRLYEIDFEKKKEDINHYLKLLDLEDKVSIENGRFSTVKLSGGQRKRLALLVCYLEDRPVYLFDEWAADQDPEFRKFFYQTLLPEMKQEGKIVFVISHDDRYYGMADKLIKMELGKYIEDSQYTYTAK